MTLTVRATPRGGRDAIEGIITLADGRTALKARVSVAAEDGQANVALAKLIAKAVGLPASQVRLIAGHTSRLKSFRLTGDAYEISARLAALCAARASGS